MLLAHHSTRLPLDLDELATRWSALHDIDASMREFRELVAESQESHVDLRQSGHRFLDVVHCGDLAAENEATQLDN